MQRHASKAALCKIVVLLAYILHTMTLCLCWSRTWSEHLSPSPIYHMSCHCFFARAFRVQTIPVFWECKIAVPQHTCRHMQITQEGQNFRIVCITMHNTKMKVSTGRLEMRLTSSPAKAQNRSDLFWSSKRHSAAWHACFAESAPGSASAMSSARPAPGQQLASEACTKLWAQHPGCPA